MKKPARRSRKSQSQMTPVESKFKRMRLHHKLIFSILGTVGVVAFWRGIWSFFDGTPYLSHPISSIGVGLVLLVISGFLYKLS